MLPTYQQAQTVPTISVAEASLLAAMASTPLPLGGSVPGILAVSGSTFTLPGHGLANGDGVIFASAGVLPLPLAVGTVYYAVSVTGNAFQVSATVGGTAIALTTVGQGAVYAGQAVQPSILAGWPDDAPQRQLVAAEAQAIQFEQIQRAVVAYAASPAQVLLLRSFLVSVGYAPADAATIASAWVDVVLEWYQTPRIPASYASWSVPLVSTSPLTVTSSSTIVLQADDGTYFVSSQTSARVFTGSGPFKGTVAFTARTAGSSGNVIPGTISSVNQGPIGLSIDDSGTQVLVQPARDTESDEDALARAQGRWGTLSGVLTAKGWQWLIGTNVPTLTRIFVQDDDPLGAGSVQLDLANAIGPATADEVAAAGKLVAANKIAGMGPVGYGAAQALPVAIVAQLKLDGTNTLALAQAASALYQLGPAVGGDALYIDTLVEVLMGISGVVNVAALSITVSGQPFAATLGSAIKRPVGQVIVITPTVTT